MKRIIKAFLPRPLYEGGKKYYYTVLHAMYRRIGRRTRSAETAKAKARRLREGFFDNFCRGTGLDIGYGGDLLAPNCTGWDFEHGNAQYLTGVPDCTFDFVYSSHTLEHMVDPEISLKNWWRVVKLNGFLIVFVPDRDLYEKKKTLPSAWNLDHKHFFSLVTDEKPDTLGIVPLIQRVLPDSRIVDAKVCSEGCTITDPKVHSNGEYSIEVVVQKRSV
jgi:SAM-dependent methyltransferase